MSNLNLNESIKVDLSELPVVCIMGPTASGKTALAMALYDHLPCDIISVDSALVYKGMDIGTAKPTVAELRQYPHQLIDIRDPAQTYSAADFCQDALQAVAKSRHQGRIPILVGGTMMYFKSLLSGISPLPEADVVIRKAIEEEAKSQGWQALHNQLASFDPVAAQRIHPNDPQRISRAIEVYRKTTKTMTQLADIKGDKLSGNILQFALIPEQRHILHERIELRFHQMVENNFQQEVEALIARGDLHQDLPAIRCVGYRQMWQHLHGQYNHDEMVFKGICATRQLAKRQLTWLRGWDDCYNLSMDNKDNLQLIMSKLSKFEILDV